MNLSILNIALCVVILILGCLAYRRKKDRLALGVGLAFGLFAISHILALIGAKENLLIAIRAIAYLMVIIGLYKAAKK